MEMKEAYKECLPFTRIPLPVLERIVSKLDFYRYVQLQQTCKMMLHLAENNKNIRIRLKGPLDTTWITGESRSIELAFYCRQLPNWKTPYGLRAGSLRPPKQRMERFDAFCTALNKYRITSSFLGLGSTPVNKEQCLTLLNFLKPVRIHINSAYNNHYEALLESKLPDRQVLRLTTDAERLATVISKIVPQWKDVYFDVLASEFLRNISKRDNLLIWVLQFLNSEALPNLEKFNLDLFWEPDVALRPREELIEVFRRFTPTVLEERKKKIALNCTLDQSEIYCKISIRLDSARIYYEKGLTHPEQKDFG